jgi:hypothetical protein
MEENSGESVCAAKEFVIETFEVPPRPTAGVAVRRVYEVSSYPSDGKISRLMGFAKASYKK